jgi:hypothetical protein
MVMRALGFDILLDGWVDEMVLRVIEVCRIYIQAYLIIYLCLSLGMVSRKRRLPIRWTTPWFEWCGT